MGLKFRSNSVEIPGGGGIYIVNRPAGQSGREAGRPDHGGEIWIR